MQSKSLRATALLSLTIGALSSLANCQAPSATALPSNTDDVGGLPAFLLRVPAGKVHVGLDVATFADACAQAAYSFDWKNAHKNAAEKYKTALRRSSSMIGRVQYDVPEFYLAKWPVKNSEYLVWVDKQRAAGNDIRPPYHWWRYGCEKDYNERLPDIRKAFPKDKHGALNFWEENGHKLPYKVQDEKGESLMDHPVVFVTWREANIFAASIGMRLPTELEMERAMRGDGTHTWPGGERGPEHDVYTEKMLKFLGMARTSDLHLKPVGTVQGSYGPFGHWDLFGQVWQMVGDVGFAPIHDDMDAFLKQWGLLKKHPTARIVEKKPLYQGHLTVAKGGSYLSYQEPVQLMIDARAPIQTTACLESLGMRLAKSFAPGYDFLYSMQRVQFSKDAFSKHQKLDLDSLVGTERYEMADNGFPKSYDAVAFAPVNFLVEVDVESKLKKLKALAESSQRKPILIGALATSANFDNGQKAGLYSVFYRQAGIPRELRDAVKAGHREVSKARKEEEKRRKAAEKAGKEYKPAKKQQAVRKWRMVTKKFGLTDDDIADSNAKNGDLGYVKIDGIKVPTDKDSFILATKGSMVSVLPGTKKKPAKLPAVATTMEMEATKGKQDKMTAKFHFGIPLVDPKGKEAKNVVVFDLHAVLDLTEGKPWRLPMNEKK